MILRRATKSISLRPENNKVATPYNKHLTLFDWVGLANFKTVLGLGGKIGNTFWRVLGWTIVWAVCATFLCNFLGLILAIVINRKETKCKAFWRTCFVISIAVPQFVSLLVMRQMLQEHGAINNLLMEWGLIQNPLPFWTNTMWYCNGNNKTGTPECFALCLFAVDDNRKDQSQEVT